MTIVVVGSSSPRFALGIVLVLRPAAPRLRLVLVIARTADTQSCTEAFASSCTGCGSHILLVGMGPLRYLALIVLTRPVRGAITYKLFRGVILYRRVRLGCHFSKPGKTRADPKPKLARNLSH